MTLPKKEK